MLPLFLLIALITLTNASPVKNCTDLELKSIGSGKYYIEKSEAKSWGAAKEYCLSHNLHLLAIETEEENTALGNFFNQNTEIPKTAALWSSGSDVNSEGNWVWTTTNTPFTFNKFYTGYTNNNALHNCMYISMFETDNLQWADAVCETEAPFICEQISCV